MISKGNEQQKQPTQTHYSKPKKNFKHSISQNIVAAQKSRK